jgi:ABC-2 type transport system ATP-binding protein
VATGTSPASPSVDTSTAPARHALVVENLTKRFGDRVAFSDVSFIVEAGEVFGFLGPNGAGKTTMVRTLGTLVAPSAGRAWVAGIPLEPANGVAIRERISVMTENAGLYRRLSVQENLEYFVGLYALADSHGRIERALEAVNLTDRRADPCGSLSKGLGQRVALARALLADPEILFLDEPTSGLDPIAVLEVNDLIRGLRQRGVTIFLTTHRLDEAERLCDRVAILNTTLRTLGRPGELRGRLFQSSLEVTTGTPLVSPDLLFSAVSGLLGWVEAEPGHYTLSVSDPIAVAPEVVRALVGAGADVMSIGESQHSLEDVYLQLVGDPSEEPRP